MFIYKLYCIHSTTIHDIVEFLYIYIDIIYKYFVGSTRTDDRREGIP